MKRSLVLVLVAMVFASMSVARADSDAATPCSDITTGNFQYTIMPTDGSPGPVELPTIEGFMKTVDPTCSDVLYIVHVVDATGVEFASQAVNGNGIAYPGEDDGEEGRTFFHITVLPITVGAPPSINLDPLHWSLWGETILPDTTRSDLAPDTGYYGPMSLGGGSPGYQFH